MKVINDEFWIRILAKTTYIIALYVSIADYLLGNGLHMTGGIIEVAYYSGKR